MYQTMVQCSDINEEATEVLRKYDRQTAIAKKTVISKYQKIVDLDDFDFVAALLKKEQAVIEELQREGVTERTTKMCSYTTSAVPGAKYERFQYEEIIWALAYLTKYNNK